ncbi:hypothetical protein [Mesorhizobium sp. B2-4-19]|nr:hypothetical protein [Mesorhizobium sp. B2-4-19]
MTAKAHVDDGTIVIRSLEGRSKNERGLPVGGQVNPADPMSPVRGGRSF